MKVNVKKIAIFALTPGFIPIIKEIGGSGFSHMAFFIAQIFRSARLLPYGHAYLYYSNLGQFGLRDVFTEAGKNLIFDKKNTDQIVIFFTMALGVLLLALQIILTLFSLAIFQSNAQPAGGYDLGNMFVTQNPDDDIALVMLDMIFGVEDIFGSCVSKPGTKCFIEEYPDTGGVDYTPTFPNEFHIGLHTVFGLYSTALLVVGVFILLYFIVVVLGETMQDGTPMGRRFNRVWAPIRLVAAIGLLMPIGQGGLNSAQYITLYAAKFGSGFATNAWNSIFLTELGSNYFSEQGLIAIPSLPSDMNRIMQFLYVAAICTDIMNLQETGSTDCDTDGECVKPYVVGSGVLSNIAEKRMPLGLSDIPSKWDEIMKMSGNSDIFIYFGKTGEFGKFMHRGGVKPYCGSISIPVKSFDTGSVTMQQAYYHTVAVFYDLFVRRVTDGEFLAKSFSPDHDPAPGETATYAKRENINSLLSAWTNYLEAKLEVAASQQEALFNNEADKIRKYGWGGAAIWYNRIAELNGALTSSAFGFPKIDSFSTAFETVLEQKNAENVSYPTVDMFNSDLANGQKVRWKEPDNVYIHRAQYAAYNFFESEDAGLVTTGHTAKSGNSFYDTIKYILGTKGLYNIRTKNSDIHPLAQLSAVGKSIIESTVIAMGGSLAVGGILGGITGSQSILQFSKALSTFAMIGLTIGFLLFYVLPFMPFIYLFFSVGTWVKGIFEAMAGVPLWALAHLRIDGEGLPGEATMSGYYLIFEVFLRPIILVFSLIGSILVFSAAVMILNNIWDIVVINMAGANLEDLDEGMITGFLNIVRGPIDQFFYLVVYTIVVYMIGMSCFKMIYLVPNQILRWMGANVSTFGDQSQEPAQGFMRAATIGATKVSGNLQGIVDNTGTAATNIRGAFKEHNKDKERKIEGK